MIDVSLASSVIAIFVIAGVAKGIVGNGLPVISIGLLTLLVGLHEAIVLAVIPAFITNIWQASSGGYIKILLRRLWPYLLASVVAVLLGTKILIAVPAAMLTIVLGCLISIYAFLGVMGLEFRIPARWEKIAGPIFGFLTGLIGGMTGSPAYPGIYFLNGLGFSRNQLVQAMGLAFSVVTLSVAISMKSNHLFSQSQFMISILAVIPAMLGMVMGARIRKNLTERIFKKLFYASMLILGLYLILRSIGRLV